MQFTTRHRARSAGALAIAGAIFLAGCSAGAPAPTDPDAPVEIDWWSWNPDDSTVTQYLEAFEEEYPNITVNHRFIQYSDYVNATRLALTSDSGPDVFGLQVGSLTEQFAPLAADLAPLAADGIGADWQEQLLATEQLAVDGKQVGLPWMVTAAGIIWVNQGMLDELGVAVPTTLAEWTSACETIEAAGKTCFVQGAKDAWQNIDVFQAIANQVAPGAIYEAFDGEAEFDSPDMVEAFELWKQLFDDGIMQDGALGAAAYPDAADKFRTGEAAMIAFGTWQNSDTTHAKLAQFAETYGDASILESVFMPVPFPAVTGTKTNGLFGGPDVGWAISAKSTKQDAAWQLVEWLSSSDAGQAIIATSIQQPALKSVPVDLADVVTPEQVDALESQLPQLEQLVGPRQISDADVQTALGDALSAVASGQQSPKDAAAAVQSAIDAAS